MADEISEIKQLLIEIRDAQRETFAASRKSAEESLANQRQAIERQEQAVKIIWRVVTFALIVIVGLVIFLIKLRMESYQ